MTLYNRPRRLRTNTAIRALVAETRLTPDDFIVPLFVDGSSHTRTPIPSMPGYNRLSLDLIAAEAKSIANLGLKSILLFVKESDKMKDNTGASACNPNGLMHRAIKEIKNAVPEILLMTDVALDPYSSYGHDGIVKDGQIVNDETVTVLAEMACTHIAAGADWVAPSDMMDGRIGAIRQAFEHEHYIHAGIMAYSAKYASCFYGPFRDALDSAPGFGDKKTYQMDPANSREAIHETLLDVEEGADMVMVKPAGAYLDIIRAVKEIAAKPVSAYQVSGEYAMIKAAAAQGWLNEEHAMMESLLAIKRAGADLIATYFAREATQLLNK
jgi:porphobilinogen synthase